MGSLESEFIKPIPIMLPLKLLTISQKYQVSGIWVLDGLTCVSWIGFERLQIETQSDEQEKEKRVYTSLISAVKLLLHLIKLRDRMTRRFQIT